MERMSFPLKAAVLFKACLHRLLEQQCNAWESIAPCMLNTLMFDYITWKFCSIPALCLPVGGQPGRWHGPGPTNIVTPGRSCKQWREAAA